MTQRKIPAWAVFGACFTLFQIAGNAAETVDHGPAFARFHLTLEDGLRTETTGPFYYSEKTVDQVDTWAVVPFYSHYENPGVESWEDDFLYPLFSNIHYGHEHRWQFFQLLSISGGHEPSEDATRRFTVFPFYFRQRSTDTNLNYTAYVPFYGHLKNRLFHDEMYFVMFPIFGETRKRDVVTDNYVYPIVHVRHGDGMKGWQVWPFVGHEHKVVTMQTNGFGDVTLVGGHDASFYMWPFHLKQDSGIGTDDPEKFRASIPFYAYSRSPLRDSTSVLFPFFTWIDDRGLKYHEWEGPWPLVIFTRGEGKTTSRVWPLFSRSHNDIRESTSYLWPVYTWHRLHSGALDEYKTRVAFYLYEDTVEKNLATGAQKRRVDMWPFFTWHRDFNGDERLQVLAPLEPAVPENRGIERNWSPLWSFWRSEINARTGTTSRSLFWNFYRRETRPGYKKVSLCFGLFQYESGRENDPAGPVPVPVRQ